MTFVSIVSILTWLCFGRLDLDCHIAYSVALLLQSSASFSAALAASERETFAPLRKNAIMEHCIARHLLP